MTKAHVKKVSSAYARRVYNRMGTGYYDPHMSSHKAAKRRDNAALMDADDLSVSKSMVYCPLGINSINPAHLTTFRFKDSQ